MTKGEFDKEFLERWKVLIHDLEKETGYFLYLNVFANVLL